MNGHAIDGMVCWMPAAHLRQGKAAGAVRRALRGGGHPEPGGWTKLVDPARGLAAGWFAKPVAQPAQAVSFS